VQEKPAAVVDTKPKKAKEPTSFTMTNPSRVLPSQVRFVSLVSGASAGTGAAATGADGASSSSSAMEMESEGGESIAAATTESAADKGKGKGNGTAPSLRYLPICRQTNMAGIILLRDCDPDAPETVEKGKADFSLVPCLCARCFSILRFIYYFCMCVGEVFMCFELESDLVLRNLFGVLLFVLQLRGSSLVRKKKPCPLCRSSGILTTSKATVTYLSTCS
jgi:hypothetical protein